MRAFEIKIDETSRIRLHRIFRELERAGADMSKPAKEASISMLRSVMKNFEEEGRPQKWAGWTEKYRKWRQRIGKPRGILFLAASPKPKRRARRTRVYSGELKRSITPIGERRGNDIILLATSKIPYAATHQFGRRSQNIPARPYLMFQDEDVPQIVSIFQRHLDSAMKSGGAR